MDRLGAGGSFTEMQALNFHDGVVEMGHDGPAHLAISEARPLLRGLGVFHGKRGWGVSVEFDVAHGAGYRVRHQPRPPRRSAFCGVGGRGAARPTAANR